MSCVKHFLAFRWERHAWSRRVNHTECRSFPEADQWGRVNPAEHVVCHAQYVCRDCGAVRDGEECGCDLAQAEQCAVRLAWLARANEREHGARA